MNIIDLVPRALIYFFTSREGSNLKQALYTKDRALTYFLRNSRMCEKNFDVLFEKDQEDWKQTCCH